MERLRKNILLVASLVLTMTVAACGDDKDDKKEASFPTTTYDCSASVRGRDGSTSKAEILLRLIDNPEPRFQGDVIVQATVTTPEVEIDMDMLLAMRVRGNRRIYDIRQGLELVNESGPRTVSNMQVSADADLAPTIMALEIGRDERDVELEIVSGPLKRTLRNGGFSRGSRRRGNQSELVSIDEFTEAGLNRGGNVRRRDFDPLEDSVLFMPCRRK